MASATPPDTPVPETPTDTRYPLATSKALLQVEHQTFDIEEEDQFLDDFPSEDEFFDPHLPSGRSSSRTRSITSSLRLTDNSQDDTGCFARNVNVPGWTSVGDKLGGAYVVFDCAILTKEGTTIHVHKRYSAFLHLQEQVEKAAPELKAVLPAFPPKNTFAKYRPAFLEKRRRRLQSWLAAVLLHPVLGALPCVRQWVIDG